MESKADTGLRIKKMSWCSGWQRGVRCLWDTDYDAMVAAETRKMIEELGEGQGPEGVATSQQPECGECIYEAPASCSLAGDWEKHYRMRFRKIV